MDESKNVVMTYTYNFIKDVEILNIAYERAFGQVKQKGFDSKARKGKQPYLTFTLEEDN